jgi:hypothetical protein
VLANGIFLYLLVRECFGRISDGVIRRFLLQYTIAIATYSVSETFYNTLLDVFLYNGMITQRHPYQAVIVSPPLSSS